MMKKTPGPLAPPLSSLPSLNMTDLSYSWNTLLYYSSHCYPGITCTTLMVNHKEKGRVVMIRIKEQKVNRVAHRPGVSAQTKHQNVFPVL